MSRYLDAEVAPLDDVTSLEHNLVLDMSIPYCVDSSEYPPAPTYGQRAFDGSIGYVVEYQGATTGWTKPWGEPWGTSAGGIMEDDGAYPIGTGDNRAIVETTGIFAPPNRIHLIQYRICYISHDNPLAAPTLFGSPRFYVNRGVDGTSIGNVAFDIDDGGITENARTKSDFAYYVTADSGANTYALVAEPSGPGTLDVRGDLTPTQIIVTDVGAAGPPP